MSLYDLQQNRRINETQRDYKRTARNVQESQESIEELQQSVKQLSLVCKAMWQLLQATSGLSDRALLETLQNLEQETAAKNCTSCGRVQQAKKPTCLYCGTAFPEDRLSDSCFQI